jgi:hypothetical protein
MLPVCSGRRFGPFFNPCGPGLVHEFAVLVDWGWGNGVRGLRIRVKDLRSVSPNHSRRKEWVLRLKLIGRKAAALSSGHGHLYADVCARALPPGAAGVDVMFHERAVQQLGLDADEQGKSFSLIKVNLSIFLEKKQPSRASRSAS